MAEVFMAVLNTRIGRSRLSLFHSSYSYFRYLVYKTKSESEVQTSSCHISTHTWAIAGLKRALMFDSLFQYFSDTVPLIPSSERRLQMLQDYPKSTLSEAYSDV